MPTYSYSYAAQLPDSDLALGTPHIDEYARAQILEMKPAVGTVIPAGGAFFADGRFWKNNTTDSIEIPDPATQSSLKAAGFTDMGSAEAVGDTITNILFDPLTQTVTTYFQNPTLHPPIETDLSGLDDYDDKYDTYADLGPSAFKAGVLSVVLNTTPGRPRGIYKGTGTSAVLQIADEVNTYRLDFQPPNCLTGDPGVLILLENGINVEEIELPYTTTKFGGTYPLVSDIPTTKLTQQTIFFITKGDEDKPRGIYFVQSNGDAPVIWMELPLEKIESVGYFEQYTSIPAEGSEDKAISFVTIGNSLHPPGVYVGDGTEPVLIREWYPRTYQGTIEYYNDADTNNYLEDTLTFITIGDTDNVRGIYRGTGTDLELLMALPVPYITKDWGVSSDIFEPGDLFIQPNLHDNERLWLFRVPSTWDASTDVTGGAWTLAEQDRYDIIGASKLLPTREIVIHILNTDGSAYPTTALNNSWLLDTSNNTLNWYDGAAWHEYTTEMIPHGAIAMLRDGDEEYVDVTWRWDAEHQIWEEVPPVHVPEHLRLHPVQDIPELLQLIIDKDPIEDNTTVWVKNMDGAGTGGQYTWQAGSTIPHTVYDQVDPAGNGIWHYEWKLEHLPLRLDPVDNITALKAISVPLHYSITRTEDDGREYIFNVGVTANENPPAPTLPSYADPDGTGAWVPVMRPEDYPHKRLEPVADLNAMADIVALDWDTVKVMDDSTADNKPTEYVFELNGNVVLPTDIAGIDGVWHRVILRGLNLNKHITVDAYDLEDEDALIAIYDGVDTLNLPKASAGRRLDIIIVDNNNTDFTLVAASGDEFEDSYETSTDGLLEVNQPWTNVRLMGTDNNIWFVIAPTI